MSDGSASTEALQWEQRMSQIQRLRTLLEVDCTVNSERNRAAWTIYNLMLDAKELNADILQLRQQVADLRAERDEARREVCKLKAWNVQERLGPEGYALLRKWDCFARDTSQHL